MAKEDHITCAKYAKDNDLLDKPGWKSLNQILALLYLLGCISRSSSIPNNVGLCTSLVSSYQMIAIMLSRLIRTATISSGSFSIGTEMDQIDEYDTFPKMRRGVNPLGYHQHIKVHFVFYVKHDLPCKSWLVAGGHTSLCTVFLWYVGIMDKAAQILKRDRVQQPGSCLCLNIISDKNKVLGR
jgi:hypothetical protein